MPLVKKNDKFPTRPILVLLVGTPFSRKTSLANTCKNPILIDADRGSDRSFGRPDTFVIQQGWSELETEDNNGLFNGYDTAILDTAKAILDDFLMEHVIGENYKLRTNKMQMYGAIGDKFKLFVNKRRSQNMDIVIISHDKTKDDDGVATVSPDITGGSKNLILRIADQVGFVSNKTIKDGDKVKNVVTVNFNPSEIAPFCKNVANLPELILPDKSDPLWKGYMEREIMQPTKDAISKMTDEQLEAMQFIESWHIAIDAIDGGSDTTADELMETYNGADGLLKIGQEHLKKQVGAYFTAHLKKIGWKWDKTVNEGKGGFVPAVAKPAETPPATPPANQALAPAEQQAPPAAVVQVSQAESNPAGLMPKPSTPSIQVPETAAGEQGEDLFANVGE